MNEVLEYLISIFAVTFCLWIAYLPIAWLGEERFMLGLMRKEGKSSEYWIKLFPVFIKREIKAALALFIFIVLIAFIESILSKAN